MQWIKTVFAGQAQPQPPWVRCLAAALLAACCAAIYVKSTHSDRATSGAQTAPKAEHARTAPPEATQERQASRLAAGMSMVALLDEVNRERRFSRRNLIDPKSCTVGMRNAAGTSITTCPFPEGWYLLGFVDERHLLRWVEVLGMPSTPADRVNFMSDVRKVMRAIGAPPLAANDAVLGALNAPGTPFELRSDGFSVVAVNDPDLGLSVSAAVDDKRRP